MRRSAPDTEWNNSGPTDSIKACRNFLYAAAVPVLPGRKARVLLEYFDEMGLIIEGEAISDPGDRFTGLIKQSFGFADPFTLDIAHDRHPGLLPEALRQILRIQPAYPGQLL